MDRSLDQLASEALARAGIEPFPAIDIEKLAYRLGISSIASDEHLVEDGRLVSEGRQRGIVVRKDASKARRRFTIAHELGHLVLIESGSEAVAQRLGPPVDDVERMCDDFAAAILMPFEWVSSCFAHRPQNLSTIRHLAHQTGTSLSASAVRLTEVLGWRVALLRWRLEGGRWRFMAGAALPFWLHGQVRSAPETNDSLHAIFQRTTRDTRTKVPFRVGNETVTVDAQVSLSSTSALVLLDLARSQSQLASAMRVGREPRQRRPVSK